MTCEQAELRMAELLAGEVLPAEREALERHLLDCAACRGDFEVARLAVQVEWPDAAVPRDVVERTRAAFRRPPRAFGFFRLGTGVAAAFAAAFLMIASARQPSVPETVQPPPPRAPVLAYLQEASVGSLAAKDEDGRPVGELALQSHSVRIEIQDGVAKTTVEENFRNHTDRRLEGTFLFPLPADASISRLALEVNGKIEEGTCLERERAREVFESIVRKMQDPALLEWMPGGIFKCRVFPIEPRSTKRVIVAYTQALPFFRGKGTYVYPLASEKTRLHPPEELRLRVEARFSAGLRRIESPSHRVDVLRPDDRRAALELEARHARPEKDFVLTMEAEDEEARVVAHKEDGDDGYFALFLSPRIAAVRRPQKTVFVLDVSASVSAPELEAARKVVRAMMERRIEGDRFEILAHHVDVLSSGEVDLRGANEFLARLEPLGACDVLKALRAAPEGEIVYIGEGNPTIGETDAAKILEAVKGRRIRTVGIGSDANTALLEKLGGHFRVSPNDAVDARVEEIATTFGSPAISGLRVGAGAAVYDVVGVRDCFAGERLVVAGRYRAPAARLTVEAQGYRREIEVSFPAKEEGNNYVRRLWAQRKVADLLAEGGKQEEVTALGVKHQIMTPYTSFLVLESEQMWKDYRLKREVQKQDEVMGKRSEGEKSVVVQKERAARTVRPGEVHKELLDSPGFERFTIVSGGAFQGELPKLPPSFAIEGRESLKMLETLETDFSANDRVQDVPQLHVGLPLLGAEFEGRRMLGEVNREPAKRRPKGIAELEEEGVDLVSQTSKVIELPPTPPPAKVDPGRLIAGRPAESPVEMERLLERFALKQAVEAQLTRDASGRPLGKLEFDPQTKSLLVTDTPQVLERVGRIVAEAKKSGLVESGIRTDVAPRKPLDAKVTAVANEIGLVVISIGKDDGVLEGDRFVLLRGQEFVSTIVIDRTDRRWSSGRVVIKRLEPRVADDASNQIVAMSAEVLEAGDTFVTLDRDMARGWTLVVTREEKFVAIVRVIEGSRAEVYGGLAVGRILPGDKAKSVDDLRRFLTDLPREAKLEMASRAGIAAIRERLGW